MSPLYDTMLAEYLKNPWGHWLSLDTLAEKKYDYEMISYSDITEKKNLTFHEVSLEKAAAYSWEDVYITYKLYKDQQDETYRAKAISQQENTNHKRDILIDIELPLMQVLSDMEMTGIKIDKKILEWIGERLSWAIEELQEEIYTLAGEVFNIHSPKQVWEILFEKLALPSSKKTKTGYSVNAEVLEGLKKEYPIAEKIVTYRHYCKLRSTYIEGLLKLATDTDRIHTSYNQTVTSTGRLSSNKPNLQNIPIGNDIAGEIRSGFIPDEDSILAALDYSQVEVRLLAIMSRDDNLLKAFQEERDIHQVTAEYIFWSSHISPKQRQFAKAVNFWVIYGISPFGLSNMIDISQKEAKTYIESFYENYPKVRSFYDDIILNCKRQGYVETLFWRRRYIKSINDQNKMMQKWAEREAINMPIQGSSADIIKLAMIQISKMLREESFESKMLLQVHDELVFNIKKSEQHSILPKIQHIMEHVLPSSPIPLKVDIAIGNNWKECK